MEKRYLGKCAWVEISEHNLLLTVDRNGLDEAIYLDREGAIALGHYILQYITDMRSGND